MLKDFKTVWEFLWPTIEGPFLGMLFISGFLAIWKYATMLTEIITGRKMPTVKKVWQDYQNDYHQEPYRDPARFKTKPNHKKGRNL